MTGVAKNLSLERLFLPGISAVFPAKAQMLISEQEAALPAAADTKLTFRGVTRGPKVQVISPAQEAAVKSPFNLKLKFESFGGAKIDPASVKATYLKSPYWSTSPNACRSSSRTTELRWRRPSYPGEHVIAVQIKDTEGRGASMNFKINVAK